MPDGRVQRADGEPPNLLAVVVAYGAPELLYQCLTALARATIPIVVVDNASTEQNRRFVDQLGAGYVDAGTNLGYAAGVNLALERAWDGTADVLLVNPDAVVARTDVLALADLLATDPLLAAVGPRIEGVDGHPQPPDWPMPSPVQVWLDAFGLGSTYRGRRFVTGTVLLLRARALTELGRFDERYFLYAEEADWQLRAQRAGWRVGVCARATVLHVGAASSSDPALRDQLFQASAEAFARRWYGPVGALSMRVGSVVAALRRTMIGSDRTTARRFLRLLIAGGRARPPVGSSAESTAGSPPEPAAGHQHAPGRLSIVHVVRSSAFAGVERYIADVATELDRRGHAVIVIGGDSARMAGVLPPDVVFYPAVTVVAVLRALWTVRRVDVVHAHMTVAELPAALLKHRLGARLVVTRHFALPRGSTPAGWLARHLIQRQIDEQIAVSSFVASAIGEPATIVPNGVPFVADRTGAGEQNRTVVIVQRLEPEKSTMTALRAWTATGLGRAGWQLAVYGEGSQDGALREQAAGDPSIRFGGFTQSPGAVFADAQIVLAPAPGEPFGLAVAEAMAVGVPVVAARGGAHPELLGDDGVYFTPGDVADCARALLELAGDERRAERGLRLRERQRHLFSLTTHVDALERIYR